MTTSKLQSYFLLTIVVGALLLAFFIFRPFLIPISLAAMFAVVLSPVYQRILGKMSRLPGVAALCTLLIGLVCLFVPLTFLGAQVFNEAQGLYLSVQDGSGKTYLSDALTQAQDIVEQYVPGASTFSTDLTASVDEYTKGILSWVIQNLGGVFAGFSHILFSFLVFLIALYYLLRDGYSLRKMIISLSPLADMDDNAVFDRLEVAVNSVIRGNLVVSLIQGAVAGVGFVLFGLPNPVLWGMVTGLSGLIPGIGTSLVLAPAIIFLFITGPALPAIGLLLWGLLAVGLIDNLLGPKLIGKGMQLHPLIVLLSVLGGIAYFGPAGLFLGPLSVSLLFALLSLYASTATRTSNI